MRIRRVLVGLFAVLSAAAIVTCESSPTGADGNAPGGRGAEAGASSNEIATPREPALDTEQADALAALLLKSLVKQPARARLPLPPGARAGRRWAYTVTPGDEIERYAIVARRGPAFVVEQPLDTGAVPLIEAWLVAVPAAIGDGRGTPLAPKVTKAWIGRPGGAPQARPVSAPAPPGSTPEPSARGAESLELAGASWEAYWIESVATGALDAGRRTRTWYATGTRFVLKEQSWAPGADTPDRTRALSEWGLGARAALAWRN